MDHRLYWILEQISAFGVGGDVGAAFENKQANKHLRLKEVCSNQREVLKEKHGGHGDWAGD